MPVSYTSDSKKPADNSEMPSTLQSIDKAGGSSDMQRGHYTAAFA